MTGRRSRIRWQILPWLLFAASPASADLATAMAACAASSAGDVDGDFQLLLVVDVCPEAALEIESGSWAGLLGEDWRDTLTYWDVTQLQKLIAYYGSDGGGDAAIEPDALDRIVAGLEQPPAETGEKSLFRRFMDWLEELIGSDDPAERSWFSDWWSDFEISESAVRATFWTLAGVIILSALAVVVIEVLAARRGAVRNAPEPTGTAVPTPLEASSRVLTLADLERAGLRDKPAVLLELLLTRLADAGLLARRPASTHRELCRDGMRLGGHDADVLARLAGSAERVRYGEFAPDASQVDALLTDGVDMFRRLGRQGA